MSEERDPERDQQLPVTTPESISVQDELQEHVISCYRQFPDDAVCQALLRAISARREYGVKKYGKPLQTFNGRNALQDAWEEAMDLAAYTLQMNLEEPEDGHPYLGGIFRNAFALLIDLTELRLERNEL